MNHLGRKRRWDGGCDSDSSTSGQCYTRENCFGRSRLHHELHFIHHCTAENGCERRVGSISAVSNTHEARLWSKASGVEQNPVTPKKSFYVGVEVRWIQAIGIGAHEPSRDSQ
jgi:hypothetical protein